MSQPEIGIQRKRVPLILWIIALALGLNVLAWVAASLRPGDDGNWRLVSLLSCFLLGLLIGRWWALLVTCTFGVIHAIPVYLGLLLGYLSTWGEALWWIFTLVILLTLTSLGVLSRGAIQCLQRQFVSKAP